MKKAVKPGEVFALLWSDLDIENQAISVSKQATRDENGNIAITRPKPKLLSGLCPSRKRQ